LVNCDHIGWYSSKIISRLVCNYGGVRSIYFKVNTSIFWSA